MFSLEMFNISNSTRCMTTTRRVDGNANILSHPVGNNILCLGVTLWLCVHQVMLSTPVPFIPWQSGLQFPRYNLTLKIQDQRYPSQRSIQLTNFLSVSHQGILKTNVPFVLWQSRLQFPKYNLTLKIQGQRYLSQSSIQLTHFRSVSYQGMLSTPVPFIPWKSGLPFPRHNLTLKIQGQRSRSKVKVKGPLASVASSWLISSMFHINWTNHC